MLLAHVPMLCPATRRTDCKFAFGLNKTIESRNLNYGLALFAVTQSNEMVICKRKASHSFYLLRFMTVT